MEVFEKIDKPWFKFDMHKDGYMLQGEDAWFCTEARKKGYKIYCDGSLRIGHIGSYIYQKEKEFTTFVDSAGTTTKLAMVAKGVVPAEDTNK